MYISSIASIYSGTRASGQSWWLLKLNPVVLCQSFLEMRVSQDGHTFCCIGDGEWHGLQGLIQFCCIRLPTLVDWTKFLHLDSSYRLS